MSVDYTEEELNELRTLVEKSESRVQIARIESRLDMPDFIKRVGRGKCDSMFKILKLEMERGKR